MPRPASGDAQLKVAVVTGGHDFAEKPFLEMFAGQEGIAFTQVALKDESEIFEDISTWPYDVVVLYNMTQRISEKRQENFLKLLDKGVGLVVLHHAIAAFSEWPEFAKIIGAKYYLKDTVEHGVTRPASQYEHDVDYPVHIEDPNHPVTHGLKDFTVHDETYKGFTAAPDNHILLTSDHPKCQKAVGWARTYRDARVCYVQMGHGPSSFGDANYRQLVVQAVRWAAKR
jgi:hypothetical protein